MEDKLNNFKKRQELKLQLKNKSNLSICDIDESDVDIHTNSEINRMQISETDKSINDKYNFSLSDIDVNDEEILGLLNSLKYGYDKQKLDVLVSESKNTILDNIIKPFGIAKYVVAKYDNEKGGANVTTNLNFKKDIVANESDQQRYNEWQNAKNQPIDRVPYDRVVRLNKFGNPVVNKDGKIVTDYFNNIKKKEIEGKIPEGGKIIDRYTGKEIGVKINGRIEKIGPIDNEHITSVKTIEEDSKNHLYANGDKPEDRVNSRVEMARNDNNLSLIDGNMNRSKGSKDLMDWSNSTNKKDPTKTNGEIYGTKKELLEKEYKKSNDFIKKEQIKNQTKKQGKEITFTGAKEGAKMGLQQAVGIVLKELTESIFDEISDIYHNGFKDENKIGETFFIVLKERLLKIGNRILSKWEDVVKAFGDGFFSGFLSNLVTVIINMFVTTGKRVVRIIREGFFSLLKALKLLIFPPENMTIKEAAHEATKLIVAALAISGGILLEQYMEILLKSMPFADMISTVIIGIITGLATSLLVYLIDKLDLFGVEKEKLDEYIISKLDEMTEDSFENIEAILQSLNIT